MNKNFDLLQVRIVGFIGQQTLRNPTAVAHELRRQLEKMRSSSQGLLALSPLAGATDLIFAQEALGLSIPLVIVLVRPREESKKIFSGPAAIGFDRVLQEATKIEVLLTSPQLDSATRVGQKLVDEADVLLAVSDETETSAVDDPAEVIAHATRRGRSVIHLRETESEVATREIKSEKGATEPRLSIDQLQAMLGKPPAQPVIPEALLQYFRDCDTEATATAPRVRRYVLNIVMANAIASMAGAVSSSFHHSALVGTVLTVFKFGCIFIGLAIFGILRHRQSRNHWLELRLKAEVCRSAMATWHSPIAIEPLTADEVPELHPLMQALRYFRATHHPGRVDISVDAFKADYGTSRLVDQYRYFRKQAESAISVSARLTPLYWVLSGSALVLSGVALFLPTAHLLDHDWGKVLNFILVFVPIAGPALASWILAWQAIEAVSRKRARFVEMEALMYQGLIDLIHCHSWEAVHHVVKRAEKQLLTEVLEWYSFVKYS